MNDIANKVSINTIVINIILSIFKLITGIISHSNAMISDSIHSASDVFSTIIVMIGIHLASKESDKEHPYGHERLECVAAIVLSITLAITGVVILGNAITIILDGTHKNIESPGLLALIAAIISIITKEIMFWYTKFYAEKIDSGALMADAWHHRSDALSSVGALVGIGFARLGYPIMDSIASIFIFGFIIKAAIDIFVDAINKMVDHSCGEIVENKLYDCVMNHTDVVCIDTLRTRMFGNRIYVDVEIGLNGDYSLKRAHDIADNIHNDIEERFPEIKHIMIHVNPVKI